MDPPNKLITSHRLLESMGTIELIKEELQALLHSWKIDDLIDFFMEQQLYVNVLKELTAKMAANIFSNTVLSLGVQINFFIKWSEWKTSLDRNENCQNNNFMMEEEGISLNKILDSNPYGESVKNYFGKEKALNENTRKLLCEAVLYYCINNNHSLTVKDCESLGKQIIKTFPNEEMAYYYIYRRNAAPLGKLYQKYRNWKTNISRKAKSTNCGYQDSINNRQEEYITELKYEYQNIPHEQFLDQSKLCQSTRLAFIKSIVIGCTKTVKKDLSPIQQIIKEWPIYKDPMGYKIIDMDFKYLHGSTSFINNIDVFKIIIDRLLPKYQSKFNTYQMNLVNYISENKDNADNNVIILTVLLLIQSILPLPRLRKQALRKEKPRFYSIEESNSSFINFYETEAQYKENINKLKSNDRDNPKISVIGTIYEPNIMFLDVCNIKYKFFTLSKAIDICFKAFIIFNIKFPEACNPLWNFINMKFYKVDIKNRTAAPAIHMIIKEIEDYNLENIIEEIN